MPEQPGRGLRRYCLSPPRPTPLPEGSRLAPKLRTVLERLETLSVGAQRRWTPQQEGQSLEGKSGPMGARSGGHSTPALPGVTLDGSNRPSADVLATNDLLAIGRTVPTGGAPGRQHFLLTRRGPELQLGVCSGLFAHCPSGDHSSLAPVGTWAAG